MQKVEVVRREATPTPRVRLSQSTLLLPLSSFLSPLPVAFHLFPATLSPPIASMIASTRMSTAQRPAATARAFTAVASATGKPNVVAPRVANGVAARRSTPICRAEPGESVVFFLDSV